MRDNGTDALGDDATTLAERLRKTCYRTQAIVSALVLNRRYHLDRGFDGYDDDLWSENQPKLFFIRSRPGPKTAARAVRWAGRGGPRRDRDDDTLAERWYRQAMVADPTFPLAYRRLADLYYERGDFQKALGYYRRALAETPADFAAAVQAGNSARRAGDAKAAAELFAQAERARPGSWVPVYNLACLAERRNLRALPAPAADDGEGGGVDPEEEAGGDG